MRSLALLMKLQLDGIFRFSEFRYAKSGKAKITFFLRSLVPLLLACVFDLFTIVCRMYHTGSFEQYSFFTGISDGSFCRWGLFGTLDRGAMFYLSADHRDRISGGYFPGTHPLFRQKQQLTAFDDHAGGAFCHGTSGGKFHRKCIQCGVDA